ncbi:MAG: M15 family metallopeptidase [Clostridia bacterium]|nr:M15 family metallopeptidase [Clostridia bacterium]
MNHPNQNRPTGNGHPTGGHPSIVGYSSDGRNRVRDPNDPRLRDPRYLAARRAYIERRRREIRRNRIILGVIAVLILALFVFLIVMIVKGISGAIGDDGPGTGEGSGGSFVTDTVPAGNMDAGDDTGTPSVTTEAVTEEPEPTYELNFQADLSDYEKYMNPTGEERNAYLILVNADNPLAEDDIPDDMIDVSGTRKDERQTQQMRKTAAKALEALFIEAQAEGMMSPDTPSGYPLSVTSAYRSYSYQESLFTQYTQKELAAHAGWTQAQAEAKVETYSCRPGTSEHQTGLCCDMHTLNGADVSFANYEQAEWLAENCWKFGFILRFPEDKTSITGISYEPWHFRYVGRYHAYKIWSAGQCLEEYVAALNAEK